MGDRPTLPIIDIRWGQVDRFKEDKVIHNSCMLYARPSVRDNPQGGEVAHHFENRVRKEYIERKKSLTRGYVEDIISLGGCMSPIKRGG